MISMMSKDYCYKHGYEIQPLEHLVLIEGSGGASVPYLGYVGVRMCIPGFSSFDRDVLMLISSTTTQYHQRVPIQLVVMSLIKWPTTYLMRVTIFVTTLEGGICTLHNFEGHISKWLEFDVDHVRGKVVTSEGVTILTSQTTVVKGLTTITGHHKHVHMLMESSPKWVNVFIPGNTSELRPGKSEIEVVVQNRSGKDVKLKPCTEIGTVIMANIVLTTQVSNDFDVGEQDRVSSMSAQVGSTNILGECCLGFPYIQNNWIFLSMTSFHCLQVSFIRSCGKYSSSNFDVKKNIDLYNIILLRSIDVITSFVCIVNIDVFVNIR